MEELTPAQQELYDYLVESQRNQHYPSFREMMRAMNLKSPAPVQSRLKLLREKGYIDWTEGLARSVRVLDVKPQTVWLAWGIDTKADSLLGVFDNQGAAEKCARASIGKYDQGWRVYPLSVDSEYTEDDSA